MIKVKFNLSVFYYFLIIALVALLLYNIYSIYISFNLIKILPIVIQCLLLVMLFVKHIKVKLAIKVWSIIFLIIAPLMQLVGKLLKDVSHNFQFFEINHYLMPSLFLAIGCLILYLSEKTIEVNKDSTHQN